MPEHGSRARVCPYLRGRRQPEPHTEPSDSNHCILAASIHLPLPQQSRYCLGGNHLWCSRFIRQRSDALPEYITGIPTTPPPPPPYVPDLPTLFWRRPIVRQIVMILSIIIILGALVMTWQWRENSLPPLVTPRPPLPTALFAPTSQPTSLFTLPTAGPQSR